MNKICQLCSVLTFAASTPPVPAPRQAERHVQGQYNLAPSFTESKKQDLSCLKLYAFYKKLD